jgi:hypothetical protein
MVIFEGVLILRFLVKLFAWEKSKIKNFTISALS